MPWYHRSAMDQKRLSSPTILRDRTPDELVEVLLELRR